MNCYKSFATPSERHDDVVSEYTFYCPITNKGVKYFIENDHNMSMTAVTDIMQKVLSVCLQCHRSLQAFGSGRNSNEGLSSDLGTS